MQLDPRTVVTGQLLDALDALGEPAPAGPSATLLQNLRDDLATTLRVDGDSAFRSPAELASPQPPDADPLSTTPPKASDLSGAGLAGRRRFGPPTRRSAAGHAPTVVDPSVPRADLGCMDPGYRLHKVGLALSGGGAHGSFQIGALRYIYGSDILNGPYPRPDIITGASVGAVNGTKLAEGAAGTFDALDSMWNGLRRNSDMYRQVLDLERVIGPVSDELKQTLGAVIMQLITQGLLITPFTILAVLVGAGSVLSRAEEMLRIVDAAKSIYSLSPIQAFLAQSTPYWSQAGPGQRSGGICVGHDRRGRTVVAARGYDDECYIAAVTPGGPPPRWQDLQFPLDGDPAFLTEHDGTVSGVAARSSADGQIHVRHLRGDNPAERASWAPNWEPLGYPEPFAMGEATIGGPGFRFAEGPLALRGGPGDVQHLLALGWDGLPWVNAFDPAGGRYRGWRLLGNWPLPQGAVPGAAASGDAITLAGRLRSGLVVQARIWSGRAVAWADGHGVATSRVSVLTGDDGRTHAFHVGTDNGIWARADEDPWARVGDSSTSDIAVALTAAGAPSLFVKGLDYAIWTTDLASAGASWEEASTRWHSLGKPHGEHFVADPVVARKPDGTRELFCVATNRHLYARFESPDGSWSPWQEVGGTVWTGVELRLACVSLETGETRYVEESGRFSDAVQPVVGVGNGMMASAAIPGIFEPVVMNGQTYVDGGVRNGLPIGAAFAAGADEVYAISSSAPLASAATREDPQAGVRDPLADFVARIEGGLTRSPTLDFREAGIVQIGLRSVLGILPNSIVENEINPPVPWERPVYVIEPSFDVHDAFTVDPSLIRIASAYGWLRASDVLSADEPETAMRMSDVIAWARREAYECEREAFGLWQRTTSQPPPEGYRGTYRWDGPAFVNAVQRVRSARSRLAAAVDQRASNGFDLPPQAHDWPGQWETAEMTRLIPGGPAAHFSYTMANGSVVSV